MIKISIDSMGGDHGAKIAIAGAALAQKEFSDVYFLIYGIEKKALKIWQQYPELMKNSEFISCESEISMNEKPSQALRTGKGKSSMWFSIDAVKKGEADACVSAGNTGALMAMSYFHLKMLSDATRPGIAGVWPTLKDDSIVLDIGATIGADAQQLIDFAVMGSIMYRSLYGVQRPTVGLLNVGVEEVKGLDAIKDAGKILKENNLNFLDYKGFVEGNDIGKGVVQIVVTEGFSGNIALKTAEGTARQIAQLLKEGMGTSIRTKLGYLLSRKVFENLKRKMDPARVNGGILLGLNGLVIKSHGSIDTAGFYSAIRVAREAVKNNLLQDMTSALKEFHDKVKLPVEEK